MSFNALSSFAPSYQTILKDKVSLMLAMVPVLIGIVAYSLFGKFFFSSVLELGEQYIQQYLSDGTLGAIVYYLVASILSILMFFLVNYTFVLFVSILASPFNDLLSARVEKLIKGEQPESLSSGLRDMFKKIVWTILNEFKKISFILTLSIFSALLGFVPILTPISVIITAVLLAVGYLDFSWARHDITFSDCKKDIRKNFFNYLFGGGFFMILVMVPIINLIVPSLATSYFTILWMKNNEHSN